MSHYLAAAIQMAAGSDRAANLERAERLIRLAAARGANLVGLPETFYRRGKRSEEAAAARRGAQTWLVSPSLTPAAETPQKARPPRSRWRANRWRRFRAWLASSA